MAFYKNHNPLGDRYQGFRVGNIARDSSYITFGPNDHIDPYVLQSYISLYIITVIFNKYILGILI